MSNLLTWFEKGMNQYEYVQSMEKHKENLLHVYNQTKLTESEQEFLQGLQAKQLKAVILTADWCGDAMVNVPILIRIAQEAMLEARFLIRDENLELMDQYLTNGTSRSIPIFIFLDREGNEVGKWGPRAPKVQTLVDDLKANIPAKDEPGYDEAFKQFVQELTSRFLTDIDLREEIKQDLMKTLREIAG